MAGVDLVKRALIDVSLHVQEIGHFIFANLKRTEDFVNSGSLQLAFEFLSQLKDGVMSEKEAFTNEQVQLLHKLCKDLLPDRDFDINNLSELISDLSCVDSFWNKKCQTVINKFYHLSEMGQKDQAHEVLWSFTEACPSEWYCEIVKNL